MGSRRLEHKLPVEDQHTQEMAEMTGVLERVSFLEMGYSFYRGRKPSAGTL
jgi:hypothetical protein